MPKYKIGNMWERLNEPHNELFIVTTNNVIKNNGELVMGAGVAKQAALKFPGLPFLMGNFISKLEVPDYHFFILDEVKQWNDKYGQHVLIGALQTKRHYKDNSDVTLVKTSISKLNNYANTTNTTINCPLPGTGLGGLKKESVKKFTDKSPDNICYWSYE